MHRSQRTRYEAGASANSTPPPSASSEGSDRLSTLVLLITSDRNLVDRLTQSLSAAGNNLAIESVDRVSDATQRLKQNDGIDAVMMDWDLPATRGFETLLVLIGAAPELPIIILGEDTNLSQQMNLVEHGAQDYLLKRRLDSD